MSHEGGQTPLSNFTSSTHVQLYNIKSGSSLGARYSGFFLALTSRPCFNGLEARNRHVHPECFDILALAHGGAGNHVEVGMDEETAVGGIQISLFEQAPDRMSTFPQAGVVDMLALGLGMAFGRPFRVLGEFRPHPLVKDSGPRHARIG